MSAFNYTLRIDQGASLIKTFTWKTGADAQSMAPVDLTGSTARMQIRKNAEEGDPLVTLTTENGGIVLGGAAGTVRLVMSPTQTAALVEREAAYDVEIVFPNGTVRRLMGGRVVVSPEVTRA